MFTDIEYYIAWVVIAFFPLMIAIIAPETTRGKIIASIVVLAATFGFTCGMYHEVRALLIVGITAFILTVVAHISFLVLQNIELLPHIITPVINADIQKNFRQL